MFSDLTLHLQGDRTVNRVLTRLRQRVGDLTPALQAVGDELIARADQRFGSKTDPAGNPWAPWRPATARQRAKEGRGTLLEHTRLLRASLDALTSSDELVIGLGRDYAAFLELGTTKMVRRGILLAEVEPEPKLGEQDNQVVLTILRNYLKEATA